MAGAWTSCLFSELALHQYCPTEWGVTVIVRFGSLPTLCQDKNINNIKQIIQNVMDIAYNDTKFNDKMIGDKLIAVNL